MGPFGSWFGKVSPRNGRKGGTKEKGNKKTNSGFDARAWALALDRGEGAWFHRNRTLLKGDSTTTLDATDHDAPAPVALSDGGDEARLERLLGQSKATAARLREAMEAGERVLKERIASLERQLEYLAELPSHGRGGRFAGRAQDASPECGFEAPELSALDELLARALAEKDRLGSENEHLRSLVKQRGGHSDVDETPPSTIELDAMTTMEDRGPGDCRQGPGLSMPPEEDGNADRDSTPTDEVRRLERRLRRSDAIVARLREAMEKGERVQLKRIELLERRVERLVELAPSKRTLEPGKEGASPRAQQDWPEERRFEFELSALNELLARVLAEKDRLGPENERLRSMVERRGGRRTRRMPPSIVELDAMLKVELEKACRERGDCRYGLGHSTPPREVPSVLYKMACRDQPHLRYVGTFTPTTPADSANELNRAVTYHYAHVWRTVLEERGDYSFGEQDGGSRGFPASSLAQHCVAHCQRFSNEKEALQWLKDNVRVEVQKNGISSLSSPPPRGPEGGQEEGDSS